MLAGPALGPVIVMLLNAILTAEARRGPGHGDEKKEDVLTTASSATPLIVQSVSSSTGQPLMDEDLLREGIDKIVDGLVDVLNAFGVLPKGNKDGSK